MSETALRRTRRWLTIVGIYDLALVAMNVVFIASGSSAIRDSIPFEANDHTVHAFLDAWFTFILALGAVGVTALIASRRPAESRMLVLAMIVGECAYGIGGDIWLVARGYDAASYLAFAVVHLAVIVTGIRVLRTDAVPARAVGSPA